MTRVNERPGSEAEQEWLRVRAHLRRHRYELALCASEELYPGVDRLAGTPLLTSQTWSPPVPIPLERIALDLDLEADPSFPITAGKFGEFRDERYSDLVGRLAAPAVFENRPTYRLLSADLLSARPVMAFALGRYFDGIDTGEAVAHEYAAQKLGHYPESSLRLAIGSPVDPSRRPANVAVSALTIRRDRTGGDARFLLHRRDPEKVAHAGGLYQVVPVGVFQPATDHPNSLRHDFSLWRCLVREFAEELLGEDETTEDASPVDYERWPFAADLDAERQRGAIQVSCLGMGVDPLTLATDLLCVVVIDSDVFDRVFADLVEGNAEGDLPRGADGQPGFPFVAEEVERLAVHEPMQAAGAALLILAWTHRASLLDQ